MKKAALLFAFLFVAVCSFADTATQDNQNTGFINIATPTISIPATGVINLKSYIPGHAKGVIFTVHGGSVLFGHPSDLASGTVYIGLKRDNGEEFKFESLSPAGIGITSSISLGVCTYDTTVATLTFVAY
jgi:hypothetical protein